jgi:hypothetical protein
VGPRAELLKTEIEQTKRDLAGHLSDLKREAAATQKKVMMAAGVAVGVIVLYKLTRFLLKRRG